jgi:hypothetical protein
VNKVPDVALELLTKCENNLRWIKQEGFERDDLQAAVEFASGLAYRAAELHQALEAELKRRRHENLKSTPA